MTRSDAEALADWLLEEASRLRYGTISATLFVHDGQIRQLEKSIAIKERPVVEGGDSR